MEQIKDDEAFYSKADMDELERRISNIQSGKSVLKEHDIMEVEDEKVVDS